MWTEETFVDRFHRGAMVAGTPMPWRSYGRMSDDDLRAIYRFLHTLPPAKTPRS